MRKLDFEWKKDEQWWHYDEDGKVVIHKDAPKEVKDSYIHYLEQYREMQLWSLVNDFGV